MPGMMDTVLDLGLNHETVKGLAAHRGRALRYDAYRRFLEMFGRVVLPSPTRRWRQALTACHRGHGVPAEREPAVERAARAA
jgi:pyruvate, orthophosphate dikinase